MTPLLLAGSALWPAASRAQPGAPAPVVSAGGNASSQKLVQTGSQDQAESGHAQENQAFSIRIEAPQDVRALVERFLELKRYQQVPDLDNVELLRLLELSETQMRGLLATQGYFTPQIDQMLPADLMQAGGTPEVVITIEPGPRTRIAALDLQIEGAARNHAAAATQLAQIQSGWGLPVGAAFTQAAWSQSKAQVLQALKAERFAAARLANSQAVIDPDTSSAHLQVLYDSGPVFRYGAVQVQGAQRYDAVIAQRLARLPAGAEYRQGDLLHAQQQLLDSGYYAGASVMLDTGDKADPQAAPVLVNVQELSLQKLVLGAGFNTDSGPGASLEHTHNRLPVLGWRALTRLKWNRDDQIFSTGLLAPPDEDLWQWLLKASHHREQFGSTRQTTQQLRTGRTKNSGAIERNWYLQYDHSKADYGQAVIHSAHAVSANYSWTLRQFDSLVFPAGGFGLTVEAGGGVTLNPQRQPFVRAAARYLGILSFDNDLGAGLKMANPAGAPLRETASGDPAVMRTAASSEALALARALAPRKHGELLLRLEAAALRTRANAIIPPNLLFLAGGNASVRGYGYQQIGVKDAAGVTQPGRYLLAASLEYRRPVWRNGRATDWDSVVFVDAGSVSNTPSGLRHLKYGVGTGAIWRSPVGPVQLAVAYGAQERKVRLHMNLGFSF